MCSASLGEIPRAVGEGGGRRKREGESEDTSRRSPAVSRDLDARFISPVGQMQGISGKDHLSATRRAREVEGVGRRTVAASGGS